MVDVILSIMITLLIKHKMMTAVLDSNMPVLNIYMNRVPSIL